MGKRFFVLAILAALPLLAACGGEETVAEIRVALEGDCQTVRAEPTASPEHGRIAFQVTNRGTKEVEFAIHKEGRDLAELEDLKPGQSRSLKVTLEDGTYELACESGGRVVGRIPFEVK